MTGSGEPVVLELVGTVQMYRVLCTVPGSAPHPPPVVCTVLSWRKMRHGCVGVTEEACRALANGRWTTLQILAVDTMAIRDDA